MKQKLLLSIFYLLLFTVTMQAQNHVWDFGNDTTNWPVNSTALTVDTTVDGLTQVPGGGSGFGLVESNSSIWFAGTANEYTSVNRWKAGGNSGIDPSGGVDFTPTRRYLTFPVSGPVSVKIWFRQSGTSIPRDLWVTDGSAEVTHYTGIDGDTSPQYIEANYTGGAGNLYILFAGNAYNLYKLEISSTLLSADDFKSSVSTNLRAINDRIYVSNVKTSTQINIYSITGALVKSFKTNSDTDFKFNKGLWIATVKTQEGQKSIKLLTH
jgi:hypothetical protein